MPSYGCGGPDPLPDQTGEDLMNTITSDPGLPGGPSEPRPSYSTRLLLHNILCPLAADDCEIVITAENARPVVKAAKDMLHAFAVQELDAARTCGRHNPRRPEHPGRP
jgi:hypothetical protein